MAHQQPSPTAGLHPHHGGPNGHVPIGRPNGPQSASAYLAQANEGIWLQIGQLSELMGDLEGATQAFEQALRHNMNSVQAMQAISCILRTKDQFPAAVEYLRNILKLEPNNGETWSSLGHCYLMMDDLQQAYSAYQQALYHLQDPKEPKLWYGIGILYDRYGSLEHAEEAFSQVMRMEPHFEKANEIYFRLGIIYKQQQKFTQSLECFRWIVNDPPRPLTEEDIWFQIGHVHEQQKDYEAAKTAYRRVLDRDPNHAKVLQQLGWLYHQQNNSFTSQEQAIEYLEKSVNADGQDAQSWYLLGRCYMSQQKYPKAYEAYQQAVYRDGRNPTFWCSIGVLYYQINQYRDALDAYSRAIRLNPNISEVWYDLGTLYESCNNQTNDALDAYQRAADLDPANVHIKARLALLRGQPTNGMLNSGSAPIPQDVHPQTYQPAAMNGPPGPQWGAPVPAQPPQGPPPGPGGSGEWNRRLADMQNSQMPPQSIQGYDHRDSMRPGGPRGPSPRQEQMRSYGEPHRPNPPPHRGLSPSPRVHNAAPPSYGGPPSQAPPPAQLPPQNETRRVENPNYSGATSRVPPPPAAGINGPPPPGQGPIPPYGRVNTPPEVRPILENRPPSAGSGYPRPSYHHPSNPAAPGGIAGGAPPPPSAAAAAAEAAAAREKDERPPTAPPKRHREWEDEQPYKKPTTEENRGPPSIPDLHSRRPSPPDRKPSSPGRSLSELRRQEDQRRANEQYHPSEAAHHPPSLPSIQHGPPMQQLQHSPHTSGHLSGPPSAHSVGPPPHMQGPPSQGPPSQTQTPTKEAREADIMREREREVAARRDLHEPASRKMDVDEDYDDDGEDDKRAVNSSNRNSPKGPGAANGATSAATNGLGMEASRPKVESAA
ncbi:MAG: hypothetical protein M1820_004453 [Bogoriella megaspora]|nr:MAG: hypothetical protein M1820_004453 [Bogoriella megaspora]